MITKTPISEKSKNTTWYGLKLKFHLFDYEYVTTKFWNVGSPPYIHSGFRRRTYHFQVSRLSLDGFFPFLKCINFGNTASHIDTLRFPLTKTYLGGVHIQSDDDVSTMNTEWLDGLVVEFFEDKVQRLLTRIESIWIDEACMCT